MMMGLIEGFSPVRPGAVSLPFGSPFVAAGDTITANGGVLSATLANTLGRGYWVWAAQNTRDRIVPVYQVNAGTGGNQASQLLARYETDVIAKSPKVVLLLIGTNDIVTGGRTAEAILADIDAMVAMNRGIGAVTIQGKVLPRGSAASPMTPSQIAVWEAVNAGLMERAAPDWLIWDAEPVIGAMDEQHTMLPGHTVADDNVNPNTLGAQKIASVVQPLIEGLIASGDGLFQTNDAPGNLVPNGFLHGSGGLKAGGVTGTIPDGWTATDTAAGGALLVGSVIPRGDGFGQWAEMAVSGVYSGNSRFCTIRRAFTHALPSGQRVQAEAEFELDEGHSRVASVSIAATLGSHSMESMAAFSGETAGPAGGFGGVIRTQPLQLSSAVTSITVFCKLTFLNAASPTPVNAAVRFGRVGLKVV
jgi:lysophospholipase L1-like esterase